MQFSKKYFSSQYGDNEKSCFYTRLWKIHKLFFTPQVIDNEKPQKYTPSIKIIWKNLFPHFSMAKNRRTYNRKKEKSSHLSKGIFEGNYNQDF